MSALNVTPGLGLALGGGAALGAAHLGVLQVLAERGLRPQVVVGTSVGALVGAAYATGMAIDRMESFVQSVGWRQVGRMDLYPRMGMLNSRVLAETLAAWGLPESIEDLPISFGAMATDVLGRRGVVLRSGPLAQALRASIAMPGLFSPVVRGGMLLCDGGLAANVPVGAARLMGARRVIGVRLRPEWGLAADVVPSGPAAQGNSRKRVPDHSTLMIRPDHTGMLMWSTGNTGRLVDAGRAAALDALDRADATAPGSRDAHHPAPAPRRGTRS